MTPNENSISTAMSLRWRHEDSGSTPELWWKTFADAETVVVQSDVHTAPNRIACRHCASIR